MALFIVLSVFSGLIDFSLSFSNNFDPDLKISANQGKSFFISESDESKLKSIKEIQAFSKIVEERVLFMNNGKENVAYLKGIDSSYNSVNGIKNKLYQGQWLSKNTYQVVVANGIANKLSLGLMDFNNNFEVFVPKAGAGDISQAFKKSILIPVGIYATGDDAIDSKYVFTDLSLAQELLNLQPRKITNLEIKIKNIANEALVTDKVREIFGNRVIIKNRVQLNDSLYKMLNTENIAVYLIFTLVIIIALFNLIGALIMMILDKKSNLKTLHNLGLEMSQLRNIFLFQGTLLSVIGGCIGLILGIIVVAIQEQFQLIMITETLAYPVVFTIKNVFVVLATISFLGFAASLIASSRVTKKLFE